MRNVVYNFLAFYSWNQDKVNFIVYDLYNLLLCIINI